jgi:hypothetical protein
MHGRFCQTEALKTEPNEEEGGSGI